MNWIKRLFKRKPKRHIGTGIFDLVRDGHVYEHTPSWDKEAWDAAFEAVAAMPPPNPEYHKKQIKMKPYIRPEVNHCKEWMSTALDNEKAFYLILAKYIPVESWDEVLNLSIWDIFEKYSAGDRYGIWTILDFRKNEDGTFTFSEEDIAFLSGTGGEIIWKIENETAVFVKRLAGWMS